MPLGTFTRPARPPSGKLMQGSAHGVTQLDSGRVNSGSPVRAGVLFPIGLSHPLQVSQLPTVVFVSVVQPSLPQA